MIGGQHYELVELEFEIVLLVTEKVGVVIVDDALALLVVVVTVPLVVAPLMPGVVVAVLALRRVVDP